jgi:hypothetical protein
LLAYYQNHLHDKGIFPVFFFFFFLNFNRLFIPISTKHTGAIHETPWEFFFRLVKDLSEKQHLWKKEPKKGQRGSINWHLLLDSMVYQIP